ADDGAGRATMDERQWGPRLRKSNLPPRHTQFFGRTRDLDDLRDFFRRGDRVVTLLGPAGTGKTRLAIEYADRFYSDFATDGGVWFCDLTESRDLDGVCVAVARALDLPPTPGSGGDSSVLHLAEAIASRGEILLVLDNCEQVVADAARA